MTDLLFFDVKFETISWAFDDVVDPFTVGGNIMELDEELDKFLVEGYEMMNDADGEDVREMIGVGTQNLGDGNPNSPPRSGGLKEVKRKPRNPVLACVGGRIRKQDMPGQITLRMTNKSTPRNKKGISRTARQNANRKLIKTVSPCLYCKRTKLKVPYPILLFNITLKIISYKLRT